MFYKSLIMRWELDDNFQQKQKVKKQICKHACLKQRECVSMCWAKLYYCTTSSMLRPNMTFLSWSLFINNVMSSVKETLWAVRKAPEKAGEKSRLDHMAQALSHSHTLTLSHSHTLTLSHSHTLTLSHSHTLTLSHLGASRGRCRCPSSPSAGRRSGRRCRLRGGGAVAGACAGGQRCSSSAGGEQRNGFNTCLCFPSRFPIN